MSSFHFSRQTYRVVVIVAMLAGMTSCKTNSESQVAVQPVQTAPQTEESQLVNRLIADHVLDETKGFLFEKIQDRLFVDGHELPPETAHKYLTGISKDRMRVEVHPFLQRMVEHPSSGLIQIAAPIEFSSPCVQTSARPGC